MKVANQDSPWIEGKGVVVTGCCGTIGRSLNENLLSGKYLVPEQESMYLQMVLLIPRLLA